MAIGISSEWDEPYYPKRVRRKVGKMTDKELEAFVAAVHEVQRAVSGAENDLYGIFGWGHTPDQQFERNLKIDRAKRKIADALEAMQTLQEFI
jgi:hypothetical protein